jgi:hypothetical protein
MASGASCQLFLAMFIPCATSIRPLDIKYPSYLPFLKLSLFGFRGIDIHCFKHKASQKYTSLA